jgi:N-acetylglutamate synthase/N-acetylornithine aminotransferase
MRSAAAGRSVVRNPKMATMMAIVATHATAVRYPPPTPDTGR